MAPWIDVQPARTPQDSHQVAINDSEFETELVAHLEGLTTNLNLQVLEGSKVVEVKNSGVNKGRAAAKWLTAREYGFALAIGDDWTDEYTFEAMPEKAYTIKVGAKTTSAKFYIEGVEKVRELLHCFNQNNCE